MNTNTQLLVTAGDGRGILRLEMEALARLEQRQEEIAFITKDKAPELLGALNRGWLETSKMALLVNQHLLTARKALDLRRATILLDLMPDILKASGISKSNDAIREAVLVRDEEYQRLTDTVERLEAVLELLKIKARGFDNAFTAVKRILNTTQLLASGPSAEELGHRPGTPTLFTQPFEMPKEK